MSLQQPTTKNLKKILILDGETRSALAVCRSLGKLFDQNKKSPIQESFSKKTPPPQTHIAQTHIAQTKPDWLNATSYEITIAGSSPKTLAGSSKYADHYLNHGIHDKSSKAYFSWLEAQLKETQPKTDFDIIIPVTDASCFALLSLYEKPIFKQHSSKEFGQKKLLPFIDYKTFELISDKFSLMEFAKENNISVPKTLLASKLFEDSSPQDFFLEEENLNENDQEKSCKSSQNLANNILARQSLIIKPRTSLPDPTHEELPEKVCYFQNLQAASDFVKTRLKPQSLERFILQAEVKGVGVGFFALAYQGEILTSFAHQRILERPPSGGVSVLSKSIPINNAPLEESARLIKALNWTGIIMIEYKRQDDGTYHLLEINPRFWGSLQLAINCGRDFPRYLLELQETLLKDCSHKDSCHEDNSHEDNTHKNTHLEQYKNYLNQLPPPKNSPQLLWGVGLLDHLYLGFKEKKLHFIPNLFKIFLLLLTNFYPKTKLEVFTLSDLKPSLVEIIKYLGIARARRKN